MNFIHVYKKAYQVKAQTCNKNVDPTVHNCRNRYHGVEACTVCGRSGNMLKSDKAALNY